MINIRKYRKEDKPALLEIIEMNIPTYFALEERKDFEDYLQNEVEQYFVIEYEKQMVGCGGLNFFDDYVKISWDMLRPDFQRIGLGKELLKYRLDFLKREMPTIKNVIVRTSQLVYKFYENKGFELIEVKPDYWAKGYDLYKLYLEV